MQNTFWLGIQGEKNRRSSLLCHNQSVFPHAFYSWFLPFRFSFLSSLFFWLLVHCLTDGFGTMFWQQLANKKKYPSKLKSIFFSTLHHTFFLWQNSSIKNSCSNHLQFYKQKVYTKHREKKAHRKYPESWVDKISKRIKTQRRIKIKIQPYSPDHSVYTVLCKCLW